MSHIEDLIEEMCPDGVEYRELGSLIDYEQPTKYLVSSTRYDDGHRTPVLTAGQTFILGYTDESDGIYPSSKAYPVIIFDDFTTAFRWVDFPFKAKSSAMKMLRPKAGVTVDFRYVYYAMRCIRFTAQDHARYWISRYSRFRIPVPPLQIQREIVDELDLFYKLEAEIEAELEARRLQYEHYRYQLLLFDREDVPRVPLGDLGEVSMCKRIYKAQTSPDGDVPFYKIGTFGSRADAFIPRDLFEDYRRRYPFPNEGDVLISAAGTIGRTVIYDGEPAYFQDSNIVWVANDESRVTNRFLFQTYQIANWATDSSTITRLYNDNLRRLMVPVPPLEEQERIVAILDTFDTLVNDLSFGLPAELAARRKQYEYYRDRLLTFPERAA